MKIVQARVQREGVVTTTSGEDVLDLSMVKTSGALYIFSEKVLFVSLFFPPKDLMWLITAKSRAFR